MMTITEIITPQNGGIALGIIFVAMSLIQVSKIEINPWSWLAGKIGNAINHNISEQIKGVEKRANDRMDNFEAALKSIRTTQTNDREAANQYRAISSRVRILKFNEELLQNIQHSKEMFDQVLYDVTLDNNYCKNHPDFENDKATLAIQNVRRCYQKCLEEHDFI